MDLLCPKCGKTNKEPIRELVAKTPSPVGICGNVISLNAEATRARITKFADEAKEIEILKSG
jgi:hypothetical protein